MQMPDKAFIDTNILIYSFSEDEIDKRNIANNILDKYANDIIVSNQVINELTNIFFKKFKLSSNDIENAILEIDSAIPIVNFGLKTQIKAIRLKNRYNLQFYDSLIIATAIENGCDILLSEDMQHMQIIDDTLTIVNPFNGKL